MAIQAVIWDIGGVLVRTANRQPRQKLAESLGLSYEELANLVWGGERGKQAQLGKLTAQQVWEDVRIAVGLSAEELPRLQQEFFAGDVLDDELVDYIRGLHATYKTGIISNALDDTRPYVEDYWKIADAFDVIVFSAEVGVMKPDPRIFHISLDLLQVAPQEAVFIDDILENVNGAREVGLHGIQFHTPEQVRQDLEQLFV